MRFPVAVYRFEYFDRAIGRVLTADDFATEPAIREMGGTSLLATARMVDASLISRAGILKRG